MFMLSTVVVLLTFLAPPTGAFHATRAVPRTSRTSAVSSSSCRQRPKPWRQSRLSSEAVEDGAEAAQAEQRYSALLEWMNSTSPSAYVHPSFSIRTSPLGGYGGFASEDMSAGEVLLRIPEEACVTIADAIGDRDIGKSIEDLLKAEAGTPGKYVGVTTASLAAYMAKEWVLFQLQQVQYAEKPSAADESALVRLTSSVELSRFAPYLVTLPWNKGYLPGQDHCLFWRRREIRRGKNRVGVLNGELDTMRSEVLRAVRLLNPIVLAAVQTHCIADVKLSRKSKLVAKLSNVGRMILSFIFSGWRPSMAHIHDISERRLKIAVDKAIIGAFVSILSRSFVADVFSESMIPVLDIVNHSAQRSIIQHTDDEGCVIVKLVTDVKRGEEFSNRYVDLGAKDDGEEADCDGMTTLMFFARFGFWPDSTSNEQERVDL
mmetsp:Transcript_5164/g.14871  ORF Transcript_5164/g.14871 Transcript_5164/m.14871 type:complete len:432 (-) Transcript_5164:483-1778(-)